MSRKKLAAYITLTALITCLLVLIGVTIPTRAGRGSLTLLEKAALNGLSNCYRSDAFRDNFKLTDYSDAKFIIDRASATKIYLPNGMTTLRDSVINCSEVLSGKNVDHIFSDDEGFSGLYKLFGITPPTSFDSPESIASFLNGMGYEESEASNGKCITIEYVGSGGWVNEDDVEGIRICADKVVGDDEIIDVDEMAVSYVGRKEVLEVKPTAGQIVCTKASTVLDFVKFEKNNKTATINFKKGETKWEDFSAAVREQNCAPIEVRYLFANKYNTYERTSVTDGPSDVVSLSFHLPMSMTGTEDAIERALSYLAGARKEDLKLAASEKITLLQFYLDNIYNIEKRCNLSTADAALAVGDGFSPATILDGGVASNCYIKPDSSHKKDKVYIWSGDDLLGGVKETADLDKVLSLLSSLLGSDIKERCNTELLAIANIEWDKAFRRANNPTIDEEERQRANDYMKKIDELRTEGKFWTENDGIVTCIAFETFTGEDVDIDTGYNPIDDSVVDPEGGGGDVPNCYNATSLSWILCSAIEITGSATNAIYNGIRNDYLEVKTSEMQASNSNGVYIGWKTFRDIANIIFVIMLIVVIFSQVTGLGLTNYGIKKTLPTLIMVAILVNLSFILCQIAVDATNIVGDGVLNVFNNLGKGLGDADIAEWTIGGMAVGILKSIGIVVTGAATASALFSLSSGGIEVGSILIPILMVVITCLIGILFFYIVLAVRRAGVLILVTLAPVAIICYALPNTKNLFQKWLKLFASLLIVYPICSLLMGAGDFFAKILMTNAKGFLPSLTAALLQVVPFFMIPSLVRNSLTLAGNIGNKLGQMGNRWGKMAAGTFGRSDAAKRLRVNANKWGVDKGRAWRNTKAKVNEKLRNARGIGKIVRAVEDSQAWKETSEVARRNRARHDARILSAYARQHDEDVNAAQIAENFSEEMLENSAATAERKFSDNIVNNFADGIIVRGGYTNSEGEFKKIDYNDLDQIEAALRDLLRGVQANPNDKQAKLRFAGMMEVAKRKKAKGRQRILNVLQDNSVPGEESNKAIQGITQRLLLDDNFMGALHSGDAGSEMFIQDSATGKKIQTRAAYAAKTIESMKLDTVGDLDDSFQDNLQHLRDAIKTAKDSGDFAEQRRLEAIYGKGVNTLVQAASDSRYAGKIKNKDAEDFINKHAQHMYEIERDHWTDDNDKLRQLSVKTDSNGTLANIAGKDAAGYLIDDSGRRVRDTNGREVLANDAYSSQIKAYRNITLGQSQQGEIKILRRRPLPKGVVLDTATNNYRMKRDVDNDAIDPSNLRDLTPDEQRLLDKILDYNANVDIQNQEMQERQDTSS